jgi:hypothetical protein
MRGRLVLSLCDYSGVWPAPYREAGYDVQLVDLQHGEDVRLLGHPGRPVHGILAAPPCTVFSLAGNRWERTEAEVREALAVVDACLRFVAVCRPAWWALENPVGKLRRWLGPPRMYFDPCQFGDPWTKRTALWGHFTPPSPLFTTPRAVEPTGGSRTHLLPGVSPRDGAAVAQRKRNERSRTPAGFALAFFQSNP